MFTTHLNALDGRHIQYGRRGLVLARAGCYISVSKWATCSSTSHFSHLLYLFGDGIATGYGLDD
jgi:hypothetical protein